MKHGLRVNPGGFTMSLGIETQPGVPCSREHMRSLGGSKFGSGFFVLDNVAKFNYAVSRCDRNWIPENLARTLELIAMSLHNIIEWLKFLHGAELSTLTGGLPPIGASPKARRSDIPKYAKRKSEKDAGMTIL